MQAALHSFTLTRPTHVSLVSPPIIAPTATALERFNALCDDIEYHLPNLHKESCEVIRAYIVKRIGAFFRDFFRDNRDAFLRVYRTSNETLDYLVECETTDAGYDAKLEFYDMIDAYRERKGLRVYVNVGVVSIREDTIGCFNYEPENLCA